MSQYRPFGHALDARTAVSPTYWRKVVMTSADYARAAEFFCGAEVAKSIESRTELFFRRRVDVENFRVLMAAMTGRDCAVPSGRG